jgi:hypothetical protein
MDNFYQKFYAQAVLPQFGIKDADVVWGEQRRLGGDEAAFFFRLDSDAYVLVYEDHGGLGKNENFIRDQVFGGDEKQFEFVQPIAQTSSSPSYDGFKLPAPSQYAPMITGVYTLVKLVS